MKKVMVVLFICLAIIVSSCAKATSYESTTTATTVLNSIPYDAIKNLSVGEYIKFELGIQLTKVIRLSNGYLFIVTTSMWSGAGITSTFVSENDF